jgi:hypothetical protein
VLLAVGRRKEAQEGVPTGVELGDRRRARLGTDDERDAGRRSTWNSEPSFLNVTSVHPDLGEPLYLYSLPVIVTEFDAV